MNGTCLLTLYGRKSTSLRLDWATQYAPVPEHNKPMYLPVLLPTCIFSLKVEL